MIVFTDLLTPSLVIAILCCFLYSVILLPYEISLYTLLTRLFSEGVGGGSASFVAVIKYTFLTQRGGFLKEISQSYASLVDYYNFYYFSCREFIHRTVFTVKDNSFFPARKIATCS